MPTSSMDGITLKSHKRSCTSEETVTTEEAARLLGVSERSVRNYADQGILRRFGESNKLLVSLKDILSLSSMLSKCFDFTTTAKTALRALVSAVRAERRLERVEMLLGIDSSVLGTDEADVLEVLTTCASTMTDFTEDLTAQDILNWSYLLSNVTEEYLNLVDLYTANSEPWVPFMEIAQKLYESAPRENFGHRKDLEVAYAYLTAARKHLRQVAYFYIRGKYGKTKAHAAMPDMTSGERDNTIIELIFTNVQKPS
jgi:hypothetical protein